MPIKVTCNQCGGVLHAPDDSAGKRGRCPSCGTVLTINSDAPRVGTSAPIPSPAGRDASEGPTRPVPFPQPGRPGAQGMESSGPALPGMANTYGLADDLRQGGPRPQTAPSTRFGQAPPARPDPFVKTGRPAGRTDGWPKVRRGLGWVQAGVALLLLAALACPLVELAGSFGVNLPDQDPGYLKMPGLSAANEIRGLALLVPALLGLLFVVAGRMGVGAVPSESSARGLAKAAAFASLFSFLGFVAYAVVTSLAAANGALPHVAHMRDVLEPNINTQTRVERYLSEFTIKTDDINGQVQRIGLTVFAVCGAVAEFWFLGALGRIGAMTQRPGAGRRVNAFVLLAGTLAILLGVGLVVFDIFGLAWAKENLLAKWNDLPDKTRLASAVGAFSFAGFVAVVLYWRVLGGTKRVVRETFEPGV